MKCLKPYVIFSLCALSLFFSSVGLSEGSSFWFVQATWDSKCPITLYPVTPSLKLIDSGEIITEEYEFGKIRTMLFALPRKSGNDIQLLVKSTSISKYDWKKCQFKITFPLISKEKQFQAYRIEFLYDPGAGKCICKDGYYNDLSFQPTS